MIVRLFFVDREELMVLNPAGCGILSIELRDECITLLLLDHSLDVFQKWISNLSRRRTERCHGCTYA